MEIDRQIALAKAAILKGVDGSIFMTDKKQWAERRGTLLAEADRAIQPPTPADLLHADLSNKYCQKIGRLTDAFEDDARTAEALDLLHKLIEHVMLVLSSSAETQKSPTAGTEEALQIEVVAGTGFEPVTFRL